VARFILDWNWPGSTAEIHETPSEGRNGPLALDTTNVKNMIYFPSNRHRLTIFGESRMNCSTVAVIQLPLPASLCALNVIISVRSIEKYYLLGFDTV
jgi:hypothetical protein